MNFARPIATAQTVPQRGDVAANLDEHLRLVRLAAGQRVQLLVFPELSLTGYELDLAGELAFLSSDERLAPLVELAASCDMTIVVGAPARVEERLHIGAFILAPDGSIELYTKQRLGAFDRSINPGGAVPPAEDTVFEPGDHDPLVRVGKTTAAVAVCSDTGSPAHASSAADRGANCYLASVFVPAVELENEHLKLRGYALRHGMCVVMSNFGGPTGGLESAGGSAIWSPLGELLVRLEASASVAVACEQPEGWTGRVLPL